MNVNLILVSAQLFAVILSLAFLARINRYSVCLRATQASPSVAVRREPGRETN